MFGESIASLIVTRQIAAAISEVVYMYNISARQPKLLMLQFFNCCANITVLFVCVLVFFSPCAFVSMCVCVFVYVCVFVCRLMSSFLSVPLVGTFTSSVLKPDPPTVYLLLSVSASVHACMSFSGINQASRRDKVLVVSRSRLLLSPFQIELVEDEWKVGSADGSPANFTQFYSALTDLTNLSFVADYTEVNPVDASSPI